MAAEKHDASGQIVRPVMLTHLGDGATALTNRDIAADLQVLSDLKKGADNADNVAVETANVLKALCRLYGFNGTTWDRLVASAISGNLTTENGLVVAAQVFGKNADNQEWPIHLAQGSADALVTNLNRLQTVNLSHIFNGSTWDRERGNQEVTVAASADRTATLTTADQTNYNHRGAICWVNVTANPGGGETLTPTFQMKDPVSGTYATIKAMAAITGNGIKSYVLYPGGTGGLADGFSNDILPRTWRITVTHSASGTWTYSIGACYLL